MALPDRGRRYIVSERATFRSDWQRGVAEGWITPIADAVVLAAIRERRSKSPRAARHIAGWPDNVRAIRFPRSASYEQGRVEIRYEILEDDGRVWLERIRPVNQGCGRLEFRAGSAAGRRRRLGHRVWLPVLSGKPADFLV